MAGGTPEVDYSDPELVWLMVTARVHGHSLINPWSGDDMISPQFWGATCQHCKKSYSSFVRRKLGFTTCEGEP